MAVKVRRISQVGRSVARLEGRAKVSGRAEYVHNMRLPGMLFGKIFRSAVPHGNIRRIDVRAAQSLDGVFRVVTGEDVRTLIPSPYFGPAFQDQPVLALEKVRYVGEPVAVVLARDPHVAEHAAGMIEAEYDELPAVYDEVEAASSKIYLHEKLRPAGTFADLKYLEGKHHTNIALDFQLRRGDADKAFAEADYVFEHTFRTQTVMHVPLEPLVSLAEAGDDSITIYTASQSPSFVRMEIARLLGWSENQVRVRTAFLGGGFGAKLYIKLEALVAVLTLMARRPVKVALTMEEQFYHITKHATTTRIKSAISKDGRIFGRECDVYWNGGAYADIGPRVTQKSGLTAAGPYDIENVKLNSYAVYTNLPPSGALRGSGIPQAVWAYESHTDLIARELELDPVEFRRKNILREGRPHATGTPMRDAAIDACLERISELMEWKKPYRRTGVTGRRGRGVAIGFKACIAPTTSVAIVNVYADGSCGVYTSTVDMGQGSDTVVAQIAAEVLGMQAEEIRVVHPDTDVTPYDMATLSSRSTHHMGHAVRLAAQDAKTKLAALAAECGAQGLPLSEIFKKKFGMQAGSVVGVGTYVPTYQSPDREKGQSEDIAPFWMIGGTGAEVEVDVETGHFRVTKLVNVADGGKPINPKMMTTQISGAAIMQLGHTMFEKMCFEDGKLTNASLADYKIPGILDLPGEMLTEAVSAEEHGGPFGAKGVGESGTFGVSPAIANAIHDAVGVRVTSLPITPEAVYFALQSLPQALRRPKC
jgi:CO/xanthine dehydrogenase Mo-binding subunit